MADKNATLTIDDNKVQLPLVVGTLGPDAVNVGSLAKSGHFTYDSGFTSTAACESKITFINGQEGILLHRGYPIDALAKDSNYMEVCSLILNGELPSSNEYHSFCQSINEHSDLPKPVEKLLNGFEKNSHPMAILLSMTGALSAFYPDAFNIKDEASRLRSAHRLIAKIPVIVALCYQHSRGKAPIQADKSKSFTENFMHMMFADDASKQKVLSVLVRALDRIFILHADHEQNASTSTVRLAGSTGANPFACIAAGIAALWGPAHGGANEAALNMLKQIKDVSRVDEYIKRAKDPNDSFRLMGFGHRVYKNYDPRAKIMRETCHEVLNALGVHDDPIFELALKLEKIALEDEYFIEKKLYPNVDFYSGITLSALGIPTNMFTAIFALGRTVGWVSHWHEMLSNPYRLGRPRQVYTGSRERTYITMAER